MAVRKDGSITQRAGGRGAPWLVRVFKGYDATTGKRVYVSATVATQAEAKVTRDRLVGSKRAGRLPTPSRLTFGAYLTHWLEHEAKLTVGPRTFRDYSAYLARYILPFPIASVRLSKLTGDDLAGRYAEMRAVPSKRTGETLDARPIQMLHAVVKLALKRAVVTQVLPSNPAEHVTLPRGVKKEKRALTQAEAGAFLDALDGDRYEAYWTLLLMTGMRPNEATGLRWSDFDGERLVVCRTWSPLFKRTFETKTKKQRVLHLGGIGRRALERERVRQGAGDAHAFIFATADGTPLNSLDASKGPFSRVLARAGIPKQRAGEAAVTPYSLRHTSATLALANGEQVLAVSQRLGHVDATLVHKVYGHVLPGAQEAVTARYENGFRRGAV